MFLDNYLKTIGIALGLFLLLVFPLWIGYRLQLRFRGRAYSGRGFLLFALFAFSILTACLLTVLPLPEWDDASSFCARYAEFSRPEWMPFEFVTHIAHTLKAFSLSALVHNFEFQAGFFNFLLLLPFGFFLRYLYGLRPLVALAWAFGLSLAFELAQLSGLFGLYPCAYRLFQTDDLLINTAGAMYGYALVPYLGLLPGQGATFSRQKWDSPKLRRLLAWTVDWGLLALLVRLTLWPIALRTPGRLFGEWGWVFFLFILLPCWLGGQTPGKALFRLRMVRVSGKEVGFRGLLIRYAILLLLPIGINWTLNLWSTAGPSRQAFRAWQLVFNALWLIAMPTLMLWRADGRGVHDLLAGTRHVGSAKGEV